MDLPDIFQSLLVLAAAGQTIYYYPLLPEKVASHFNAAGAATGWAPKASFFIMHWIIIAVALAVSFGMRALFRVLPPSLINLPNKEYWLSEDKRAETMAFLRVHSKWLGVILLVLFVTLFQLAISASLNPGVSQASAFTVLLTVFFILIAVWVAVLLLKFSRIR